MPPPHLVDPIHEIRAGLPGSEEIADGSVGDPVWKDRGRIFVMRHGHEGQPSPWMKAPPGIQEALIASDPARWFRPPYVGHNGWVGTWLNGSTPWPELEDMIEDAWRLTASKTQIRELNATRHRETP